MDLSPDKEIVVSPRECRRYFFDDFVLNRTLLARRRRENARRYPNLACFAFDSISSEIMLFGRFEKRLLDVIFHYLSAFSSEFANATAIDIGANIGNHALYFAPCFKTVVAVEANPRAFALLALNVEHCGFSNVKPFRAALGARRERLTFAEHRNEVGRSGIIDAANKFSGVLRAQEGRTFEIEVENADSFLAGKVEGPVALVKIDVEGFEASVIRGLEKTLARGKPILLLEQNAQEIVNGTTEAVELLRSLGYRFYEVAERRRFANRYARLLDKLLTGDRLCLREIHRFEPTHYPLILCCQG